MQGPCSFSPFRCRMWEFHDRLEETITEVSCRAEIASFLSNGQQTPVLGRSLPRDPDYDVELIYGARRLFVARHLNVPLKVELRTLTDREAIIAMDIENRQRKDISAYERGLSFTRWMQSKHFKSQDEIAKALEISASQVSRLIKVSRLPSVVVGAFPNPAELRESWGLELYEACQDTSKRRQVVERARAIVRDPGNSTPESVYEKLMFGQKRRSGRGSRNQDEIVKDDFGEPLFRIRYRKALVAFLIPVRHRSPETLDDLKKAVVEILRHANEQALEHKGQFDSRAALELKLLKSPTTASCLLASE
jgi:ParB/RepB/Spo0J family partition protein